MQQPSIALRLSGALLAVLLAVTACASSTELVEEAAAPTAVAALPEQTPNEPAAPPAPTATPQESPSATPNPQPLPAAVPYQSGAEILLKTPERLAGMRVGLIANQASQINGRPLIDILHEQPDIELVAVFAPEHGIRGDLGAGEQVPDGVDPATGVRVHSLYGDTRAPTADMLDEIDVLLYDLQDVGVRYYTFISTMGLAMEAAAANDVAFVVLDRPNPSLAITSSGFVRTDAQESFVSAFPIPSSYALTAAELALALKHHPLVPGLELLSVAVYPVTGWIPGDPWPSTETWVPPSPGLPTLESVHTYPATVLFEATSLSYGRGTDKPFGQLGAPWIDADRLAAELNELALAGVRFEPTMFTPVPSSTATNPQFAGDTIPGVEVVVDQPRLFRATAAGVYLLEAVKRQADEQQRTLVERPEFFDLLAGTSRLREQLDAGVPARSIVQSWAAETASFDEAMNSWKLYPRPF